MFDVLIRNGQVLDGSGKPGCQADVAIEGDSIVEIGDLREAQARTFLDASGCVVAPGFIDMHSHVDFTLPVNPTADSLVHQGITTAVVGLCGLSTAPLFPETRGAIIGLTPLGDFGLPQAAWTSFGDYLRFLDGLRISVNVVPCVGYGTIRVGVMAGYLALRPSAAQMAQIQAEVGRAMDEGAHGLSTGLIYPPGVWTLTAELIEAARPVGARHGIYFSHIRDEGHGLLDAIAEEIRIGRESGCAVQSSHYKASGPNNWGLSAKGLALMDQAREEGLDITPDMYPYLAGCNAVVDMLPAWAREGGKSEVLKRLDDPAARARMRAELVQVADVYGMPVWDKNLICGSSRKPEYEGRFITDLAEQTGKDPFDWTCDALLETHLDMSRVTFGMSEENRDRELRYPYMMIGCDGVGAAVTGPMSRGKPHPRTYGTFARVLGHQVRDREVIPLEEAIYRMCGLPARKLGLRERGLLKRGYKADVVVFDPACVEDIATYEQPHQYPLGFKYVLVNGQVVVQGGQHTGKRPGSILTAR